MKTWKLLEAKLKVKHTSSYFLYLLAHLGVTRNTESLQNPNMLVVLFYSFRFLTICTALSLPRKTVDYFFGRFFFEVFHVLQTYFMQTSFYCYRFLQTIDRLHVYHTVQ